MKIPKPIRKLLASRDIWKNNRLILRELKHFRFTVLTALTFTIIGAFLEGATVGLIAAYLQGITNPDIPPIRTGFQWFDTYILAASTGSGERIVRLSILLVVMSWCRSAFVFAGVYYARVCEFKLVDRIRKQLFDQFQNLSLSFYSTTQTGKLINIANDQVNQLRSVVTDASNLLTRSATLIAYVVAMIVISWQLSIIAILLYSLLSIAVTWMVRDAREASFAVPKAENDLASIVTELINGIRTIQGSAAQDFERDRFYRSSYDVVKSGTRLAGLRERTKPISEAAATTILIFLVVISSFSIKGSGSFGAAALLTFMFVLFRMMPLVSQVNGLSTKLVSYRGLIDSVQDLLRTDDKPYLKSGTLPFEGLLKSIRLVDVDFSYGQNKKILENISIEIEKNKTTALVGASGAGKTTLADLIPRFYDPTRGEILIDGIDLKKFDSNSFRRRIAVVSQDTFIFNRSAKENIAYGIENVDEVALYEAAALANALDFILEMPSGFDTILGDRGVRLSGGQRQRIAIARALLRNPDILILDEATSALDSTTEKAIQKSLENLSKGRTVIAIAHRLSTIMNADKIIVLEKGKVIEQGTYKDLLSKNGALRKYHNAQFSESNYVETTS